MVLKTESYLLLLTLFVWSCRQDNPLASIKNLPIMSEQARDFSLEKNTWIRVYGTGEASIDMVNVNPAYLYKPDAIEVYLKQKNGKKSGFNFPLQDSLGRSSNVTYTLNNIKFRATYDIKQRLYQAKISIPWKTLGTIEKNKDRIWANVVVADDDDYTKQKAKLAWAGNEDPLFSQKAIYGELLLKKEKPYTIAQGSQTLVSVSIPTGADLIDHLPSVAISNLVYGQINKPEDFSAKMCSAWNKDSLFLYLTILDNKEGRIDPRRIKSISNFHDWGWIEDAKGHTVWEMTNFQTQHAGGAQKNRKIDTSILLKKGRYKLKYITDESHSWDNWDDEAPDLPFYGIEIFELPKRN